jgi:hypothetical protein
MISTCTILGWLTPLSKNTKKILKGHALFVRKLILEYKHYNNAWGVACFAVAAENVRLSIGGTIAIGKSVSNFKY